MRSRSLRRSIHVLELSVRRTWRDNNAPTRHAFTCLSAERSSSCKNIQRNKRKKRKMPTLDSRDCINAEVDNRVVILVRFSSPNAQPRESISCLHECAPRSDTHFHEKCALPQSVGPISDAKRAKTKYQHLSISSICPLRNARYAIPRRNISQTSLLINIYGTRDRGSFTFN